MCNCLRIVYLLAGVITFGPIERVFAENTTRSGVNLEASAIRAEKEIKTIVTINLSLVGEECVEVQVYSVVEIGTSKRFVGVNRETPAVQLCPIDRTGMYQQFILQAVPKGACITTVARKHGTVEILNKIVNCL